MEPNNITIKGLLEAGIHFGHKVRRWNPKMAPYIYGQRRLLKLGGPSVDEFLNKTPPPWSSQQSGF